MISRGSPTPAFTRSLTFDGIHATDLPKANYPGAILRSGNDARLSALSAGLTLAVLLIALAAARPASAADLIIQNQAAQTLEGGIYDRLAIQGSTNITIRNATFTSGALGAVVDINNCRNLTLDGCTISGLGTACTGINIGGNSSEITISDSTIRDIADDGIQVRSTSGLHLLGNRIFSLLGIGTDSGGTCNNGHSDGIELGAVTDSEIVGNLIFDVRSTSAIFFGNWSTTTAGYCRNILIANNIFCTPEAGFVVYLSQADGVQFHHNTLWWGRYGGVAIAAGLTNLDMENNILHSINYAHHGVPYDAANHRFRRNIVGTTSAQSTPSALFTSDLANIVVADPRFTGIGGLTALGSATQFRTAMGNTPTLAIDAFQLRADSLANNAGNYLPQVPTDIRGNVRSTTGMVDVGAFEIAPNAAPASPTDLDANAD